MLEWARKRLRGVAVDLVTMGSPFTHLYQYYLPDRYPPLFEGTNLNSDDWGTHFTSTVQRWVNIYRVDAFVGTHVDGTGTFPMNAASRLAAILNTGVSQSRYRR